MSQPADSLPRDNRIDALCDRFEQQWLAGESPRIEDVLADSRRWTDCQSVRPQSDASLPEIDRAKLLRELLLVELELRQGNGESPTAAEFGTRFPDDATVIAEAFAASDPDAGSVRVALHVRTPAIRGTGVEAGPFPVGDATTARPGFRTRAGEISSCVAPATRVSMLPNPVLRAANCPRRSKQCDSVVAIEVRAGYVTECRFWQARERRCP